MTMHLAGPGLTTTRTTRRPRKNWASAEQKRRALELEAEWNAKQQAWQSVIKQHKTTAPPNYSQPDTRLSPAYPPGREPQNIPSKPDTVGVAARRDAPVYTGNNILGIGTLHKSNAVPVFTEEEAVSLAGMRR